MNAFRNIMTAVVVGIFGGLLVATLSYYNTHKEGGARQTLLAVANSFGTIADAYAGKEDTSLYSRLQDYDLEEGALEAFEELENGTTDSASTAVWKAMLEQLGNTEAAQDILAMDGATGGVENGTPYSGILRFHVRANSDSKEDQELKMAVKEDVITMLRPILNACGNVEQSKETLVKNMDKIYKTAVDTITEQGYDYEVKVYVTEEEFPEKTYGDLTFPAGDYQALRIDIGEAKGQNWWCVLYPPLCFVDESTAVVSEETKQKLQENLTSEEYAALFRKAAQGEVKIRKESAIWNWFTDK